MIVEKDFETFSEETQTGLLTYITGGGDIYITCGEFIGLSDSGDKMFNGYTILDIEDAKQLITELNCLVKKIENNTY
jgi:hypothetical protein